MTKAVFDEDSEQEERVANATLITDLFDLNKVRKSPNFVVKSFKDSYFVGQVNLDSNMREGFGVCQYENSRHYEGSWKNDKREGKGYERFSNGNVYIGDY